MKKIILSLFLFVAPLSWAFPIKSVTFHGLVHLSPQIARDLTGLKVGNNFTYELSNQAIIELYKQGYFNDVWIEEDNGNINVHVKEKPTIALIDFEGVSEDDKKALKDIVGIKKGMVYDKSIVKLSKDRVVKFFEAKGYFDTIVEEFASPLREESSLKVLFKVNRGETVTIKSVKLFGSDALSYSDVEPVLANKQREALGWMWGFNDGKLRLEALPTESDRIQDKYFTKGYLDAKVSDPYLKLYYDTYNADIVYKVSEGSQYSVKSIDISLPIDLINVKNIKEDLHLQAGDIFNVEKLRKDMDIIETKVADKGYAYARVYPNTTQDKNSSTVSIVYNVALGDKVHVNRVIIGGNTRTADHVIRREMEITAGDLYNRTNLNESKASLKRTGYFENVTIAEKRLSRHKLDLIVKVKEASTGSIQGGIGYGSSQGFLFDIGVSDKNIFGTGLQGVFKVSRSDDELSGRISLTNPRIFDSRYSLGGSVYAEDNDWNSYEERVYGGSIVGGRSLGRYTNVYAKYVLEQTELSNLDQSLKDAGYEEKKSIKSAFIPSIVFNNTDDYYLPRSGMIASSSLEYAGIGGDEKFIKNINSFKYFYGLEDLIGYDIILRYKARLRYVWDKGNLPLNEKLYLGGIGSVRGYESRSIGYKNAKGYDLGGTKSFNNSVEASFPLINRLKMRWALFYDYGTIGTDKFDDFTRSSAGVNLEWVSPLGAINLIFAKPIDKVKGDETNSFEFTIGRQF